ncbi:HNH endonuclease [Candidatus Pacearchaeota archaeon]|nr:HNH endonuclease [Candidatus Pacearchaeota archaeon]
MEKWKQVRIEGVLLNYEVSTGGRVRNRKTHHIKSQNFTRGGYQIVCLSIRGLPDRTKTKRMRVYTVARLVADAFLRSRGPGEQIEHKNQDKTDNRSKNLMVVTQSVNIQRSYDLTDRKRPENCNRLLSEKSYELVRKLWDTKQYSQVRIGNLLGLCNSTVSRIVNGKINPRPNGRTMLYIKE